MKRRLSMHATSPPVCALSQFIWSTPTFLMKIEKKEETNEAPGGDFYSRRTTAETDDEIIQTNYALGTWHSWRIRCNNFFAFIRTKKTFELKLQSIVKYHELAVALSARSKPSAAIVRCFLWRKWLHFIHNHTSPLPSVTGDELYVSRALLFVKMKIFTFIEQFPQLYLRFASQRKRQVIHMISIFCFSETEARGKFNI